MAARRGHFVNLGVIAFSDVALSARIATLGTLSRCAVEGLVSVRLKVELGPSQRITATMPILVTLSNRVATSATYNGAVGSLERSTMAI